MTRIRWSSDRSGVAHAHTSGRTLCHAPAIAERDAWPAFSRCPTCAAASARMSGERDCRAASRTLRASEFDASPPPHSQKG
jgi:hypothetical protein